MTRVIVELSMSLDGYVALADDTVGRLFDWFTNCEVVVPTTDPELTFRLTPQSAAYWQDWTSSLGALVVGRLPARDFLHGGVNLPAHLRL